MPRKGNDSTGHSDDWNQAGFEYWLANPTALRQVIAKQSRVYFPPIEARHTDLAHELNALVGKSRSGRAVLGIFVGLGGEGAPGSVVTELDDLLERIRRRIRQPCSIEVFVPAGCLRKIPPRSRRGFSLTWFRWFPEQAGSIRLERLQRNGLWSAVIAAPRPITAERLVQHLAWLRANIGKIHDPERSTYAAALRLRAETCKDGTPDAIVPKGARRGLRKAVDVLIDESRRAYGRKTATKASRTSRGSSASHGAIRRAITSLLTVAADMGVSNGIPVEWPKGSTPMSPEELVTFLALPGKDPDAAVARSPSYRRQMTFTATALLASGHVLDEATTPRRKNEATSVLNVAAAMLAHASDGLPQTPDVVEAAARDANIAAMLTSASPRRR